jgi:transcriptional regulator
MFVRPVWKPRTLEEMHRLIDEHPWALLVNNGEDGPHATNLALLLDRSRGERGTIVGHIARANEHARVLQEASHPTLAIFEGPYSYVTASWYPNRDMPSTYYYTAVHCYGRVRLQTDAELERWLAFLTGRMETPIRDGWKITEVPLSEITRRLPFIMGFEIEIQRIEGKFKLGQDEPKRDALAVSDHLARGDDPGQRALGEMTRRYNADRSDTETP